MGAPNWAEIITALATAATVGLLLWDRLWRRLPELIVTVRPIPETEALELHHLVIGPIDWGCVVVEKMTAKNGELAKPVRAGDGQGGSIPTGFGDWQRELRIERQIGAHDPRGLSMMFGFRRKVSSSRKTSVITVTSLVTSPIKRRVRNKIAISINS